MTKRKRKGFHHENARHLNIKPPRFGHDGHTPDCQHDDLTHLFFAPDFEGTNARKRREHKARLHCAECPFQLECALHGLEHEDYGIWGGLSEGDRYGLGGRGVLAGGGRRSVRMILKRLTDAGFRTRAIERLLAGWEKRCEELTETEEAA